MNRAERIYRLHALLKAGRPVSLRRMQETLEASRATVVRDLGYMRDFMNAPIVYDRELKQVFAVFLGLVGLKMMFW